MGLVGRSLGAKGVLGLIKYLGALEFGVGARFCSGTALRCRSWACKVALLGCGAGDYSCLFWDELMIAKITEGEHRGFTSLAWHRGPFSATWCFFCVGG